MPYRVTTDADVATTHELGGPAAHVPPDDRGRRRVRTSCGRTVTGWTGWSFSHLVITCGSCNRLPRED